MARTTARISGVESGIRWALQQKKDARNGQSSTPDIENAYLEISPDGVLRQTDLSSGEILPAYNAGDRSPPYAEQQQVSLSRQQQNVGWTQQLVITTSGLGVAMSDDSIRSLKYCLGFLRWANERLGGAVQSLKDLLRQWDSRTSGDSQAMSVSNFPSAEDERAITARIAAVKQEVLNTLKQVVNIVSTYAGGALPENARRLVHQHLVTLPQRFTIASRRASDEESHDVATNNANRALVLAQEGLDMMNQVSRVVNDTLVSAENWCEKLGRRRRQPEQHSTSLSDEKVEDQERAPTAGRDSDVKMEM